MDQVLDFIFVVKKSLRTGTNNSANISIKSQKKKKISHMQLRSVVRELIAFVSPRAGKGRLWFS